TPVGDFDSIVLFVTPKRGSLERYRVTIVPGLDPDGEGPRSEARGADSAGAARSDYATVWKVAKSADGYVLEALLPWTDFETRPRPGAEMGFQVMVMDADGPDDRQIYTWWPLGFPREDTYAHHRIRLAEA
ncbi:MAG: sugar-binding protein, partial [Acidobacteriota bacterium]